MANREDTYQQKQRVTVLGSTGSIGINTLDVLFQHQDKYDIFALTANQSDVLLFQQCLRFKPRYAVMVNPEKANKLKQDLAEHGCKTEVLSGAESLIDVANDHDVDTVMAAIVGGAGLLPTLAAINASKKVLLANKESLVMAGNLFMNALSKSDATLLPIDSEHNAIFQCLPSGHIREKATVLEPNEKLTIRKIILTGSGGPFRTWSTEAIANATPDQACNHPNWSMGRKISVDSATLMNKGLEFIEAKWLFGVQPSDIEVLIHPQSIVHSMVEYIDGSVIAQLGNPDMRTPIAHALAWPDRIESSVSSLDWLSMSQLSFEAPDFSRFPGLSLCIDAASGPSAAAPVLNAANEVAVEAFLNQQISFIDIVSILDKVLSSFKFWEPTSIDDVLHMDSLARESASIFIKHISNKKTA